MINKIKIKTQQKIIEKLQSENKSLKEELETIKLELELEKNTPKQCYKTTKKLMTNLTEKKELYEKLIEETKAIMKNYKDKEKEMNELKVKFNKEMKTLIEDIKNTTRTYK